jgi:hypothetical protein
MSYCHQDLRFEQADIKTQLSVTYIPFDGRKSLCHAEYLHNKGCTNAGLHIAVGNKFCTVATKSCGSSAWNVLYLTFLVPRMLRWLLEFLEQKLCTPVHKLFAVF